MCAPSIPQNQSLVATIGKMAQGRDSAVLVAGVALICLLVHCEIAGAATYVVGDKNGWTFNVVNWPAGKSFKAGDVLVFRYNPAQHNLVVVNGNGYKSCTVPRGSTTYKTGNDRITLAKGASFFICSFAGHCQAGMKIQVNAA